MTWNDRFFTEGDGIMKKNDRFWKPSRLNKAEISYSFNSSILKLLEEQSTLLIAVFLMDILTPKVSFFCSKSFKRSRTF